MKNLWLFLFLFAGCVPTSPSITEPEVVATIEGFFRSLDVENDNPTLMDSFVTEDFLIHEYGRKMDKAEFKAFVSGSTATQSDWTLTDFRISIDQQTAHASLFNTGVFLTEKEDMTIRRTREWLESAYLVKEPDGLKIKFYFSDNIGAVNDTLQ